MDNTNFKNIKKGDTFRFSVESFSDETETSPIDISGYTFTMVAKYSNGTTAFTKNDAAFVETTSFKRTVTLSANETNALTAGELSYQIDVVYPDTTAQEWMRGYILVFA